MVKPLALFLLLSLQGVEPDRPPAGVALDARTGAPLAGAAVRVAFSHMDDGYPPLPGTDSRHLTRTDARGLFRLPPFRVEDPRVKALVEIDHPEFLPVQLLLADEPDLAGNRAFVTARLRRARTVEALFRDPDGRPLAGAAIEVEDPREDAFLGEDTWEEGQTFRAERSTIRYTGPDGTLRLPERVVALTLRDPALHLVDLAPQRLLLDQELVPLLPFPTLSFTLDLRPENRLRPGREAPPVFQTRWSPGKQYLLRDLDRRPVADSLIEVSLQGMPAVRLHTDAEGRFLFGPLPLPEGGNSLSTFNPRRGSLTVLSPLFWKRALPVALPAAAEIFVLPARPAGRLSFRLREALDEGKTRPAPAESPRISEDLTLVRRTRDGEAVYEGTIPRGDTILAIAVNGHLPEEVRIPPHLPGKPQLDLGEVLIERGGTFTLRVRSSGLGDPSLMQLSLAERESPSRLQVYRLDRQGAAQVGGLLEGRSYLHAIEGPAIQRIEGEFLATEQLFEKGLTLQAIPVEETAISGEVMGVRPEHSARWRVIERFYLPGESEPRAFRSYPLPPDGQVGSLRQLHPIRFAEVFVVGPGFRVGYAARDVPPEQALADLGRILPRESYNAVFTFQVEGLGKVAPPASVTLFAESNRDHEIARMTREGRELRIENLRPGLFRLRWGGDGEAEAVHSFLIRPDEVGLRTEVRRRPQVREEVEFRIVDSAGEPVEGARVRHEEREASPARPAHVGGGVYRVDVGTREENRLHVLAEGFLPARVVHPPGARFPDPVALRRGARARALVRDAGGRRYSGPLLVSFEPAEEGAETSVLHGEAIEVQVVEGIFESAQFPPGRERITFRIPASEAKLEAVFDIAEKTVNDLGALLLRETRSLHGAVHFPLGEPAAGAQVSLVKPENARRFPQRPERPADLLYSARSDALGRFRIDGLPIDLKEELALVARLDGWSDAIEDPVDLDAEEHPLYLGFDTLLALDVGYDQPGGHDDYEFRLQHIEGTGGEARVRDLGPLDPTPRGGLIYRGIAPGIYRVLWGLLEPHPAIPPRMLQAAAFPGVGASLVFRVGERVISGEAVLNEEPLLLGWVLFLEDPGRPAEMMVGRVRQGAFRLPVPLRAERGFAALIPEANAPQAGPPAVPAFARGECLPVEIDGFRWASRRGFISVRYLAHDLTVHLPAAFMAQGGATIEFPHHVWTGGGFRRELKREPLEASPFRLRLIPHGHFSLRIAGRGGSYLLQDIQVVQDLVINLGR